MSKKKLSVSNEESLDCALNEIKTYFKKHNAFDIHLQKKSDQRTNDQLKYYYVLVGLFQNYANDCGNQFSKESISDFFKDHFFYKETILPNGELIKERKSVSNNSDTDKKEMNDFITQVEVYLTDHGIEIPEKETQQYKYYIESIKI